MQADLIFGGVSGGGAERLGAAARKQLRRAGCDSRAPEEHRSITNTTMRFHTAAAALAACASCAQAFKDTSPFLLWSSSPYVCNPNSKIEGELANKGRLPSEFDQRPEQLQSAGKLLSDVKDILSECSSKIYYIIPQPSTSSSDLKTSAPHLRSAISDKSVKGRYTVSEVVGLETGSSAELVSTLVSKCGAVPMSHEAVEEGKTVFVEFENGVGELGHIGISSFLSFLPSFLPSLPLHR
jgi:hypothetical protein